MIVEKLLNGNSLPALEQTKVFLNAYQMDMSKAADHVFKFELKFIKTVVKKQRDGTEASEEKDISRGYVWCGVSQVPNHVEC